MRRLPARPDLPVEVLDRMAKETTHICAALDRYAESVRRFDLARKSKWFKPVVNSLEQISGSGKRCMFCSGSESSDVEHFKPKRTFPELALIWENLLYVCCICNKSKGNRFPPNTEPGAQIINPIEENVWDFFFIDEYGNLTSKWRIDLDSPDPRSEKTIEILSLDRDALQQSRKHRINQIKTHINDSLRLFNLGELTQDELAKRCNKLLEQPFQKDVADYFLAGPGREESPFKEFTNIAGI